MGKLLHMENQKRGGGSHEKPPLKGPLCGATEGVTRTPRQLRCRCSSNNAWARPETQNPPSTSAVRQKTSRSRTARKLSGGHRSPREEVRKDNSFEAKVQWYAVRPPRPEGERAGMGLQLKLKVHNFTSNHFQLLIMSTGVHKTQRPFIVDR